MVKGKTIEEALKIKKDDIVEEFGGPPSQGSLFSAWA
jgi:NifU-like protein involved in Fe-S cluster formation